MGTYINFVIKNDFFEEGNHDKMYAYSKKTMELVMEEWRKLPFNDDFCYVDDFEGNCSGFTIGDSAPWGFWPYLHNGYWAVETTINDYMMHWKDEKGFYMAWSYCCWLCKVLGQKEGWICLEDRLNNSADAPEDLSAWMDYAQKEGIVELTQELMETFNQENRPFEYREVKIRGRKDCHSYPIFHVFVDNCPTAYSAELLK